MSHLTATLNDAALIGSYLHDATLVLHDVLFDGSGRSFVVNLERIGYEYGEPGRFLLLWKVTRYPWVPSTLTITDVEDISVSIDPHAGDEPEESQTFLSIEYVNESVLVISMGEVTYTLSIAPSSAIQVSDIGGPLSKWRLTEHGGPIFVSLPEIEELRRASGCA